jgi:hypothetical protein
MDYTKTGEHIEEIAQICVTGERIQEIAHIYLGTEDDFLYNPRIMEQTDKHLLLTDIDEPFNNHRIIFLYPHRMALFSKIVHLLQNPFVLITHNSDYNLIEEDPDIQIILKCERLVCWWGQNLCFIHPKMRPLPIGLANSMWEHGKLEYYMRKQKTADVYFNFNINTNPEERRKCAEAISLPMLPMMSVKENVERLATYRWCICPEGNGVDTHRLWECLYLGCVPIVRRTPFIDVLVHYMEIPLIVLDEWNQFCLPNTYQEPAGWVLETPNCLTLQYYIDEITKT